MEIGSQRQAALYSCARRYSITSNCRAPTVPMILRPLSDEVKSCATPSSMSLIDAFGQLLEFQRIGILDITELFGCEGGNACEFELFAFGEGVADLEVARVVQADDVARVGEVDDRLFLGHESRGRGEFHLFAAAHVQVVLVAFERAGADLQEGDAVPVIRVHVGVDLEDEACHFRLGRLYDPGFGRCGARRGGDADETLQGSLLHAEIIDRRTEEDRGQFGPQVSLAVESVVHAPRPVRCLRAVGWRSVR